MGCRSLEIKQLKYNIFGNIIMQNIKQHKQEILDWLEKYKNDTKCNGVVIGISGGKDSTTVAMLAKKVWGNNVVGVLMPNGDQADIQDSFDVVHGLNMQHLTVNIGSIYKLICHTIDVSVTVAPYLSETKAKLPHVSEKAQTNIPPRIRMIALYAIAQTLGYRVIGTGNASEQYIGWTTKWGDGACDLNPIQHLTCTEVVELGKLLAKEFGLDESFIVKQPSDGLTGKSDEDNFGFTYEQLDKWICNDTTDIPEEVKAKIEKMHAASRHKFGFPCGINIPY